MLIFFSQFSFAQNIFDANNSEKYATFLLNSKDYKIAINEYERLVLLCPDSIKYKQQLVLLYKLTKQNTICIKKIEKFFEKSYSDYSSLVINTYLQVLILEKQYNKSNIILESHISLSNKKMQRNL